MKNRFILAWLISPLTPLLVVWLTLLLASFNEGDSISSYLPLARFLSFSAIFVSYLLVFLIGIPTYWFHRSIDKNSFKNYMITATAYCFMLFLALTYEDFSDFFQGLRTAEFTSSDRFLFINIVVFGCSIFATMISFWAIARPDKVINEEY